MILVKRLPVLTALLLAAGISAAEAAEGTVEFFNESGGYGYVTDNETDETYIFETADVSGSVQEGDAVTYEVTTEDDRFSVKAQSVVASGAVPLASAAPEENEAADDEADAGDTDEASDDGDSSGAEISDDAAEDSDEEAADAEEAADEEAESDDSDESSDDGSE